MGREIFYCVNCGARILPEDFESGDAIALNNQNYCANCKPRVAPELPAPGSLESEEVPVGQDLGTGSSALRRAVKAPLPTMTTGRGGGAVGRQTTTPLRVPAGGRSPGLARPGGGRGGGSGPAQSPNTVIMIVIGGLVVLILIILAVMSSGGGGRRTVGEKEPSKPEFQAPVVKPPTKEDLEQLKNEVYDLLRNQRKNEARAKVQTYKSRFPGFDLDKLSKLLDEIEVW